MEQGDVIGTDPAGDLVVRAAEFDTGTQEAWRYINPCGDDCHHPVHAFKVALGTRHLEWWLPGSVAVKVPASQLIGGIRA